MNTNRTHATLHVTLLENRFTPAALMWVGDVDANWNSGTPGVNTNWSSDALPAAGDILIFPAVTANRPTSLVNDLPMGLTLASLQFVAPNYAIAGNAIQLNGSFVSSVTVGQTILTCDLTLSGAAPTVRVDGEGSVQLDGAISGSGFVKAGAGLLVLGGTEANTYAGTTTVSGGTLQLAKSGSVAVPGPLTVALGTVITTAAGQLSPTALINLSSSAVLQVGLSETIGPLLGAGAVRVDGSLTLGSGNGSSVFTGGLSGAGTLTKVGTGTLSLGGSNTFSGSLIVSAGRLLLTGSLTTASAASVATGAVVEGTGRAADIMVQGTLAVGNNGAGTLVAHTVHLAATAIFPVQLNSAAPGTGYDQLQATTIDIAGAKLTVTTGQDLQSGDPYTIIDNMGPDPVAGTFGGLFEGANLLVGTQTFRITYLGGDGNDVVLTRVLPLVNRVAVGAGLGRAPLVRIYDTDTGDELREILAFAESFTGGVSVGTGDVDGDGVSDVVIGAGPGGGPVVRVYSGRTGSELASFFSYDPSFRGGVNVSTGDVDGDGRADIVTGTGVGGGPHVRAFDARTGSELASFFAYDPSFRGGVDTVFLPASTLRPRLIITGSGVGKKAEVRFFSPNTGNIVNSITPFEDDFIGGIAVG